MKKAGPCDDRVRPHVVKWNSWKWLAEQVEAIVVPLAAASGTPIIPTVIVVVVIEVEARPPSIRGIVVAARPHIVVVTAAEEPGEKSSHPSSLAACAAPPAIPLKNVEDLVKHLVPRIAGQENPRPLLARVLPAEATSACGAGACARTDGLPRATTWWLVTPPDVRQSYRVFPVAVNHELPVRCSCSRRLANCGREPGRAYFPVTNRKR